MSEVYIETSEEYEARMPDFAKIMEVEDRRMVYGCILMLAAKSLAPDTKEFFKLASLFGPGWMPMTPELQAKQDKRLLEQMLAEPSEDRGITPTNSKGARRWMLNMALTHHQDLMLQIALTVLKPSTLTRL